MFLHDVVGNELRDWLCFRGIAYNCFSLSSDNLALHYFLLVIFNSFISFEITTLTIMIIKIQKVKVKAALILDTSCKLGYVFIKNNFLWIFHTNLGRIESGISFEDWKREKLDQFLHDVVGNEIRD